MNNKKKIIITGAIVVILLFAFSWLIYVISSHYYANGNPPQDKQQGLSVSQQIQDNNQDVIQKETQQNSAPVTIAIYGSDARSSEASRSDVIMLVRYNPATNNVSLISIPRDSRVNIPTKKVDKINHAYAFGGAKLLTRTLNELFDINIDYYCIFKFDNFKDIVDKLGGVQVNSKTDIKLNDGEVYIPKGFNLLSGEQALFYVRFRYDAEGDFGRIKRQQQVIQSIYEKLFYGDHSNLKQLIPEIYANDIETNIELSKLLDYNKLLDAPSQVIFENYMLETKGAMIDKIYYGIIDNNSLEALKKVLTQ